MLHLTNPQNFYRLGCRKKSLSQPFFRFGFGASRSILSRFFDLNGFTLIMGHDLTTYIFLKRSDYKTFLRISISVVASFDIFTFVQSHIDTFPWVKIFWEIEKFKLIFFILCTNIWKKGYDFERSYDTLTLSISSLLIQVKDEQAKKFNNQHAKIVQKLCNFNFLCYINLFNNTTIQIAFLKY